jgi:hypothetical protein
MKRARIGNRREKEMDMESEEEEFKFSDEESFLWSDEDPDKVGSKVTVTPDSPTMPNRKILEREYFSQLQPDHGSSSTSSSSSSSDTRMSYFPPNSIMSGLILPALVRKGKTAFTDSGGSDGLQSEGEALFTPFSVWTFSWEWWLWAMLFMLGGLLISVGIGRYLRLIRVWQRLGKVRDSMHKVMEWKVRVFIKLQITLEWVRAILIRVLKDGKI